MFGVGLSRPVEGSYRECVDLVERLRAEGKIARVIAVDVPSGIHSDTGSVMGAAVKADVTVTFGWEKRGTLLYPGRSFAGRVVVENIGFPPLETVAAVCGPEEALSLIHISWDTYRTVPV